MTRFAPFSFVADLILERGRVHMLELGYLEKSGLLAFEKAYGYDPRPDIEAFEESVDPRRPADAPNHNGNARLATLNKAVFYALFADACPDIFPQTALYPLVEARKLQAPVMQDFASDIVLKVPVSNRGEGIYMAAASALTDAKTQHDINEKLRLTADAAESPVLAVQARITPDAVTVAGKPYAPTMRVIMTAYQDGDGILRIRYHGANYRLPESDVHTATSLHAKFLCMATRDDRENAAAPVGPDVFQNVCRQLDTSFKPRLAEVFAADPLDLATYLMADPNQGMRLTGLEFATALRVNTVPDKSKLDKVQGQAENLAETDIIARRYLLVRGQDEPETWSPIMGGLYHYARNIRAHGSKPVIRVASRPAYA